MKITANGIIDYSEEKTENAVIYFVKNTNRCHTLKLFKLLYFLDFESYRRIGKSVTGMKYLAYKNGPVPESLYNEIKNNTGRVAGYLNINVVSDEDGETVVRRDIKIKMGQKCDKKYFSEHDLKLMKDIAEVFKDATAMDMTQASHEQRTAWHRTYQGGKGLYRAIEYADVIRNQDAKIIGEGNVPTITMKERNEKDNLHYCEL